MDSPSPGSSLNFGAMEPLSRAWPQRLRGVADTAPRPIGPGKTARLMTIEAIMTTRHVSVATGDSLAKVRDIFAAEHFHHLLVVENDHTLAGVISERDFLKAISSGIDKDPGSARDSVFRKKAHQIMTCHPVVLHPGASLQDAIALMVEHDLSCLPVVNSWGAAIGIVCWRDLLRHLHLSQAPVPQSCPA
jgi:acetoin utilization protein AcuB